VAEIVEMVVVVLLLEVEHCGALLDIEYPQENITNGAVLGPEESSTSENSGRTLTVQAKVIPSCITQFTE
jgi:hypothetical protein